jgi:hypothetical protein
MKSRNICAVISTIISSLAMVLMIVDISFILYVNYELHGGIVPVVMLIPGFFLALAGIVLGAIGLKGQAKALAISGLVLGAVFMILLPYGFGWI